MARGVTLFVIEAPGKIPRLTALLSALRVEARVVATCGHVCGFPENAERLGVEADGAAPGRQFKGDAKERLSRHLSAPDVERVVVATDDDDEGDVIALDVARVAHAVGVPVERLRLGALTVDAVREGLRSISAVRPADAASGMTRALLDRVVGIGLSRPTHGVGRVLTPLLELAARGEFARKPVDLVCPAKDGRMPFVARLWLDGRERGRLNDLVRSSPPPVLEDAPEPVSRSPLGTGELLVRVAEDTAAEIPLVERMLQALYEDGRMSYCRAHGDPIPRSGLATLARASGWPALPDPEREEGAARLGAHPAPHPLVPTPLGVDPARLSAPESALVSVGRAQAEACLQRWSRPRPGPLEDWLGRVGLAGRVPSGGALRPVGRLLSWLRKRAPGAHAVELPLSARIVHACVVHGLGRPSTWGAHADGLIQRELVDQDGLVTTKGMRWLREAPPELREPATSRAIEMACRTPVAGEDAHEEPWRPRFVAILSGLPEALRVPLAARLSREDEVAASRPGDRVGATW